MRQLSSPEPTTNDRNLRLPGARGGLRKFAYFQLRSSALGMRRRGPSRARVNSKRRCSEPIRSRDRQSERPEETEDMPRWPENADDDVVLWDLAPHYVETHTAGHGLVG